ncbi:hypothetical protein GPECTOR_131g587 [Gonium pectorale]|uniref:ABC transporter family G domain-containing protein n=1 Tax=Gonium pectorale TaxID=33097 RepID=A0A150FYA9_GONPE|nr:hypothetical protein GPECTOR_131g587 [Gonium pectorale]|eukprot:KXZ42601.1 hypothetical protein GPECTOR_131g587 [Gonium pectorale]
MEIVAQRRIIMMDEPGSGLDAKNASQLYSTLKEVAGKDGINILAVVHQPDAGSFRDSFQTVLLFGRDGPVFCGSPEGCVEYFRYELGLRALQLVMGMRKCVMKPRKAAQRSLRTSQERYFQM